MAKTKLTLRPLGDRVALRLIDAPSQTEGGILIPEAAKEKPQTAKVAFVGPGNYQDGKLVPLTVKVGDIVLLPKYAGMEIAFEGEKYTIIREGDILAVVGS